MNQKFVEIQLSRIQMIKTGTLKSNAQHILSCRLIYPRPGEPEVLSVRPFADTRFKPGSVVTWDEQQEYKKRILFKEYVEGETQLELEIQMIEQPTLVDRIISKALDNAVNAVDQAVIGNVANTLLNLLKQDNDAKILGRGSIALSALDEGDNVQTVALYAPFPVEVTQRVVSDSEDPDQFERVESASLNAGELCCHVSVRVLQTIQN